MFEMLTLGSAKTFFYIVMEFSFLLTAVEITNNRNTKRISPFPFLVLSAHCFVWSLYDAHIGSISLLVPDTTGLIIGFCCTVSYQLFSSMVRIPLLYYALTAIVFAIAAIYAAKDRYDVVQIVGIFLIVILMGCQLISSRRVCSEKSVESIPLFMSLSIFANAAMQLVYSVLVGSDSSYQVYIIEAYSIGLLLAGIQLWLYHRYRYSIDDIDDDEEEQYDETM